MSIFDDDRPKQPSAHEIGSDLSVLSVDELKNRVALLQGEISRLEQEIAAKTSGRKAAEGLFRF
ncbi:DUF1192 family protein [Rhizobium lusitanum]|uniref:DUF1192 family protein n=1 Tax=Rhizobium lusitanum TaxID=293958 RepID=A0A6L9U6T2_9HYPH|nr:DUF1192 domain-containing protein [Rhizobium lusitanum]NEI70198.1 DUF1192 family protein [Rhizobium lusitanum]